MSIAFSLLLLSFAVVPASVILDGPVAQSLFAVLAVAGLAAVALSARAADVKFAAQVTQGLKLAAAVPAIWMAIQSLPMPFSGLSHSIWINANEALNQQSWGHISIDIGRTIGALAFYLANIALIVVTVFVARERRRTELALLALTAIATLTTIALLLTKWAPVAGLTGSDANEILGAVSALGLILSLSTGVRALERYESRRADPSRPAQPTRLNGAISGVEALVCLLGLVASATLNVGLIAGFGVVVFAAIQAIRRVGLAGWATGVFLATLFAAAAMLVIWRSGSSAALSPFLQYATAASPDAMSAARRILADTGWLGTGAGTYQPLLPIYQELGSMITKAPSTASELAITLGWPMALFMIAAATGLCALLFRGALARGRDSFYPAGAAACAVIMIAEAFCDTSLLRSCVAVIGDAVIGLGLAQRVSHRDGP